jgi:hypothetical protein
MGWLTHASPITVGRGPGDLITVADGGMASALTDRERWRGIQLGTGGSSLSTSLAFQE